MTRGQGATEYLIMLAVVLLIGIVAIALLGFFPGISGDVKQTQLDTFWRRATPVGITEVRAGPGGE